MEGGRVMGGGGCGMVEAMRGSGLVIRSGARRGRGKRGVRWWMGGQ